jgi:rod shape-determining protein MreD
VDTMREHATVVVSAIVMVLLQIILAPGMTIYFAMPNFVVVFVILTALSRSRSFGPILPFVMGLIYDFVVGGPVGAMAFALTLVCILAAYFFRAMDNGTLFMPFVFLAVSALCIEVIYGILLVIFGLNVGIVEAVFMRALPCALYDCVIGIILYPLARRLLADSDPLQPGPTTMR